MKLRAFTCIILTILIFGTVRHLGPTKKYVVDTTVSGIDLIHEAPRFHVGPQVDGVADDLDAGHASFLVFAFPAPGGDDLLQLEIETRVKGTKGWNATRFSEIVFFEKGDQLPLAGSPPDEIAERIESMEGSGAVYCFKIPLHPWTTKLYYRFVDGDTSEKEVLLQRDDSEPMMLRFKGSIPALVLYPHILFMFAGICFLMMVMWSAMRMLGGNAEPAAARQSWWAWGAMFIGGLPFGIMMNFYAFGVYWEAAPFGNDVTDNKTQVALIFWGLASIFLTRRPGRHAAFFALAAGLLSLAMYLIPHSL